MKSHQATIHQPTTRCKAYAALLPIIEESGIDPDALAGVRTHLDTCAYCQEQRAAYRQLETAAYQYLSPPASPRYQTETIMRDLLTGEPDTAPRETGSATLPRIPHSPRKPLSPRRFIASLAPLAAVLVIVLITVALFANHGQFMKGNTSNPPALASGTDTELRDIDMVSPTEGWAVGFTFPILKVRNVQAIGPGISWGGQIDLAHETVVLWHYVQGRWTSIHLPIHGELTSILMLSAHDGWAVGNTGSPPFNGLFLHYDGHFWQQVAAGSMQGLTFGRLQMLSDTDGWSTTNGSIVHYDGQRWTTQPIPASLEPDTHYVALNSVFMTSPTAGWAAGYIQPATNGAPTGSPTGVILRYLNGQWSVIKTIPNALLGMIAMSTADDGWLIGSTVTGTNDSPLLLHYTRGAWTQVLNPLSSTESQNASFDSISMRSPTDGWILVSLYTPSQQQAILHYDGSQWKLEQIPITLKNTVSEIISISAVSTNEAWIVGTLIPKSINYASKPPSFIIAPLLLHYYNGTWSLFPNP